MGFITQVEIKCTTIAQRWEREKHKSISNKIKKLNFIKINNFCVLKDTIKKVKNHPKDSYKTFY